MCFYQCACMSTAAMTATRTARACRKCAAIGKSGKLSCCAPGGDWFKSCGTSGNPNTEHTWAEGVEACKDDVGMISVEAESQSMLINETRTRQQLNHVEQPFVGSNLLESAHFDPPRDNSRGNNHIQLFCIVVFTCILLLLFF